MTEHCPHVLPGTCMSPPPLTSDCSGGCQYPLQLLRPARSSFTQFVAQVMSLCDEWISVSSAKSVQLERLMTDRTSLKWIENSVGPNTDPCGTPWFIFIRSDVIPLQLTNC